MSKIKVLARAVCREGSLLACRWLSSPCLLTWPFLNVCLRRVPELSLPLLLRPLILSYQSRAPMTSFNLSYLLKDLSPNIVTLGVRAFTCILGGHSSVHSRFLGTIALSKKKNKVDSYNSWILYLLICLLPKIYLQPYVNTCRAFKGTYGHEVWQKFWVDHLESSQLKWNKMILLLVSILVL